MRILIFGGTTEGRKLSYELAEKGASVTVCVATDYGAEEQGDFPNIHVLMGRKNVEEMKELLSHQELCIDATHPYATEVTKNLKHACAEKNVPYLRFLREESSFVRGAEYVNTAEQAASLLKRTKGNILLATGAKELIAFRNLERERIYTRVLPAVENLLLCEGEGIPRRNIIAMQGPFGQALNEAIMEQFAIRYMVTKDGGNAGGFLEKILAAQKMEVKIIIIRRPADNGKNYEEIVKISEEMMRCR